MTSWFKNQDGSILQREVDSHVVFIVTCRAMQNIGFFIFVVVRCFGLVLSIVITEHLSR